MDVLGNKSFNIFQSVDRLSALAEGTYIRYSSASIFWLSVSVFSMASCCCILSYYYRVLFLSFHFFYAGGSLERLQLLPLNLYPCKYLHVIFYRTYIVISFASITIDLRRRKVKKACAAVARESIFPNKQVIGRVQERSQQKGEYSREVYIRAGYIFSRAALRL